MDPLPFLFPNIWIQCRLKIWPYEYIIQKMYHPTFLSVIIRAPLNIGTISKHNCYLKDLLIFTLSQTYIIVYRIFTKPFTHFCTEILILQGIFLKYHPPSLKCLWYASIDLTINIFPYIPCLKSPIESILVTLSRWDGKQVLECYALQLPLLSVLLNVWQDKCPSSIDMGCCSPANAKGSCTQLYYFSIQYGTVIGL